MASLHHGGGPDYPEFPGSCIPSIIPPGIDPALADFREFYPYIPNEVKHRKRTTQAQLEILEDMFSRDKKPNGASRLTLARELNMTPRGVQVWFQNRRAKEKTLAKKALAAKRRNQPNINPHIKYDSSTEPEAVPQDKTTIDPSTKLRKHEDNKLSKSPPIATPSLPPHQSVKSESAPASAISPATPCAHGDMPPGARPRFPNLDGDINSLRRPSLPIMRTVSDVAPHNHRLSPNYDWQRRSSFDANVNRLANHPFAHLAAQVNGSLSGPKGSVPRQYVGVKSNSLPGHPSAHLYAQSPNFGGRIPLSHRASMPYVFAQGSLHTNNHTSQGLNPALVDASSRYHHGAYVMQSRVIPAPVPGPLPTPNFSFGDSTSSPTAASPSASDSSEHVKAALSSYSFPALDDCDIEDDMTNSSFDAFSRFGSIASLADSESSVTSTLYSDAGSCVSDRHEHPPNFNPDSRRSSHASGQVLDLFSTMGLETHTSPSPAGGSYSTHDNMLRNGASDNMEGPSNTDDSPTGTMTYPSPSSTASAGSNGTTHPGKGQVRISLSSELALALSPTIATEGTRTQDVTEPKMDETQTGNGGHFNPRSNDSSPVLDNPSILSGNGRACYDPDYTNQSYSVYADQGEFELISKSGQFVAPTFAEGRSSNNMGSSTCSGSSVSPLFPSSQEPPPPASLNVSTDFAGYNHSRSRLIS